MSATEIAAKIDKMNKIKSIKLEYQDKIKHRKNGRVYVYIDRKQITALSESALYGKLYETLYGKFNLTMEEIFPEYLKWANNTSPIKGVTLQRYKQVWNKHFKDKEIIKKPLAKLTVKDFTHLYMEWTRKREMTARAFGNAKTLINGIYNYAINELEIVDTNISKNANMRQFPTKQVNNDNDVFSLEDRKKILDYLEDDNSIYSLAIRFAFFIPIRIGELLALKWDDINGNKLRVKSQRTLACEMNDDLTFTPREYKTVNQTKGYHEKGVRYVFLCDKSLEILKIIRQVNPDSEYLFVNNKGQPLQTTPFNEKLGRVCKRIGVRKYSSHKIRFCVASMYYAKGLSVNKIQKIMGHSTVQMTMHYLRDILDDEDVEAVLKSLE